MHCPECGVQVPDNLRLCPQCGTIVEQTQPMRARRSSAAATSAPATPTRWQRLRPIFFWVLGFLCLLALSIGGGAYYGIIQGRQHLRTF